MPMATREEQNKYQLEWIRKRKEEWFSKNGPCVDCGTWENLQLDHVDPSQKVTHNVWSWRKDRRDAELAKCVVRCKTDHDKKSFTERAKGEANGRSVLTAYDVLTIRKLSKNGHSNTSIANTYGVNKTAIGKIVNRKTWKHI